MVNGNLRKNLLYIIRVKAATSMHLQSIVYLKLFIDT